MVDSVAQAGASEARENELASPQAADIPSQEPSASPEAQVTHLQGALSEREARIRSADGGFRHGGASGSSAGPAE